MPLRVAICEDSPSYGAELRDFIARDPGLEVCGVFRTAEALLRAARRASTRSSITMDLEMPGIGGVAAITGIMSLAARGRSS